jgi:ribonucleoside-diphosphate reductase alpha chain
MMATRLPSIYQDFIHISRYARFNDEIGRRETFEETVDRYISFFQKRTDNNKKIPWEELRTAILDLEVMPSMRCLMTAGPALEKDQVAGYNCSYVAIDTPKAFDEIMYILMCGTGVGFSVESKYTNKLPEVPEELHDTDTTVVVADSKIGWASAYREIISLLYSGKLPKWDVSKVRPAGERLKTFGGRASGPEPLVDLFNFTINIFKKARGRKMTTLECHDIVCKIADIVVCGGVRRSALISLSDLNDDHIRNAKSGEWWTHNGQRALSNNSAVYEAKVDMDTFMNEWHALYMSRSGERGIFSRQASQAVAAKNGRRDPKHEFGTNPCCLPADTVLTVRDYGNITLGELVEKIKTNSTEDFEVLGFNTIDNKLAYTKILAGDLTRPNAELIELEVETENSEKVTLKLTPDHQVYTKNRGYVRADELTESDELVLNI